MQVCPKREVEEDLSYFEDEPGTTRPSCSPKMRRGGSRRYRQAAGAIGATQLVRAPSNACR
jgi:hypothetical protein